MNLGTLISESRNPATMELDKLSTLEMLTCFNDEDRKVPEAIRLVLPAIVQAVDLAAESLKQGGRLIYLGAGTSGRLGILDAVECPPTYSVPASQVVALIAGGQGAVYKAVEGAEDNPQLAVDDLKQINLSPNDILVGIARAAHNGARVVQHSNQPTVGQ